MNRGEGRFKVRAGGQQCLALRSGQEQEIDVTKQEGRDAHPMKRTYSLHDQEGVSEGSFPIPIGKKDHGAPIKMAKRR
jgi:hypothetical protein